MVTTEQSRDDAGQFSSTDLTRARDAAIAKAGGVDALYAMIASGMSLQEMTKALGLDETDYNAQQAVRQCLRRDEDRYADARRESAEALAERAGECFGESAPATSSEAKWMNDKSGWFRWMAELRDPSIRQAGVSVNLDIGSLHLDALKASGRMELNPDRVKDRDVTTSQRMREAVEAEYEVEDE